MALVVTFQPNLGGAAAFQHKEDFLVHVFFGIKRAGAWHFWDLLTDGEIANNAGNWQWMAGTGNDTRPNRVLSPVRQAKRFDPDGIYVRRYLPEDAGAEELAVTTLWLIHQPTAFIRDSEHLARPPLNLTLDEAFVDRLAATLTALIDAGLSARSARDS